MLPIYREYALHSVFQPIFSLSHCKAVGYEALVRTRGDHDQAIPPRKLLKLANTHGESRQLDDMCQSLHIDNFAAHHLTDRWLFLNLDPNSVTRRWYDDGSLLKTLKSFGIAPQQIVIELLEGAIGDEPSLIQAIEFFRDAGALVALDDFGVGHSNFDRIWRMAPDIIKLDRSLIFEAEQHRSSRLRRILPNLVSLIHEAGSLVLCEGIETEGQALVAMESDVDFVQGFYFGRPNDHISSVPSDTTRQLSWLNQLHATSTSRQEQVESSRIAPYTSRFREMLDAVKQGQPFAKAAADLTDLPRTARVYVLDRYGEEVIQRCGAAHMDWDNRRVAPIADSTGGIWFRRQYFRSAINEPGRLQISRPYLSSRGGYMCCTLSLAFGDAPDCYVICCDVIW